MSFGVGLLRGLAVTARNFFGSYFEKKRLTTVQYPEERQKPKENFRNIPFLVFDKDIDAGMRCVACKICEIECPPQCIYIEVELDEKGNSLKRPKVFDIDMTVCMNCGICAETCPFEAIKMDNDFELSSTDRFFAQLADKTRLQKSNEYYHSIKPTEAAAVDARLAAKKKPPPPKPASSTGPSASAAASTAPTARAGPEPSSRRDGGGSGADGRADRAHSDALAASTGPTSAPASTEPTTGAAASTGTTAGAAASTTTTGAAASTEPTAGAPKSTRHTEPSAVPPESTKS